MNYLFNMDFYLFTESNILDPSDLSEWETIQQRRHSLWLMKYQMLSRRQLRQRSVVTATRYKLTFSLKTFGSSSTQFQHAKVNQWTNGVVESCLASLTKLQKPFKYIVTCVIMQKNGAGLHTASSCYWDNSTDGDNIAISSI